MMEAEVQAGGLRPTVGQELQTFALGQVTSSTRATSFAVNSNRGGIVHRQQVPVVVGIGQHVPALRQPFHFVTHPLFVANKVPRHCLSGVCAAGESSWWSTCGACIAKATDRMYFEAAHLLAQSSDHLEEGRCCAATTSAWKQDATAPRAMSLVLRRDAPICAGQAQAWWLGDQARECPWLSSRAGTHRKARERRCDKDEIAQGS